MLTLYPVWGNGWWFGDRRIEPPPPFQVEVEEGDAASNTFVGRIHSSGELDGQIVEGSPTFVGDKNWLTVRIAARAFDLRGSGDQERYLGYVSRSAPNDLPSLSPLFDAPQA